jgi:hypothetical protein
MGRRTPRSIEEDSMWSNRCSRRGASDGARLRSPFRLVFGAVVFDLMPGGWVRLAVPRDGLAREFCDLAAFIAAVRSKGGA